MRRGTRNGILIAALALWMAMPSLASAEWFGDLYLGAAWTRSHNVGITVPPGEVPVEEGPYAEVVPVPEPPTEPTRADFKTGLVLGGRVGRWFESSPMIGLALDVSYFRPNANGVDLEVIPISALLMLRGNAKGAVQPYLGAGPGLFITRASADLGEGVRFSDTVADLGLDARAGIAWKATPKVGVFTEYRFTHVKTEFSDQGINAETILNTHYLLAGLRF